jgi:hypothetical protein
LIVWGESVLPASLPAPLAVPIWALSQRLGQRPLRRSKLACSGSAQDGQTFINAIFDRLPERCDPYICFRRVRPYIHGWQDNPALGPGLIYEGVVETGGEPRAFRGQTGAQSSIVPAMDALLGIRHAQDPLRLFWKNFMSIARRCTARSSIPFAS